MFSYKSLINLNNIIPTYNVIRQHNEISLITISKYLKVILTNCKYHFNLQYKVLSNLSGIDLVGKVYKACVIYDLLSVTYNCRLKIKNLIGQNMITFSSVSIYLSANWWEREVWDLFGIFFEGHHDLRRILSDYGFEGHALLKNFPLMGFVEVRYCLKKQKIIVEKLAMAQDLRTYSFKMPW